MDKPKGPSLRKAINDTCKDCIYDPKGGTGTWRQQVESCHIRSCPLWPVRPKSAGLKEVSDGDFPLPEGA